MATLSYYYVNNLKLLCFLSVIMSNRVVTGVTITLVKSMVHTVRSEIITLRYCTTCNDNMAQLYRLAVVTWLTITGLKSKRNNSLCVKLSQVETVGDVVFSAWDYMFLNYVRVNCVQSSYACVQSSYACVG